MNVFSIEFLGRLHPLLVHLPIAALVLAALVELWMMVRESEHGLVLLRFLSAIGAAGAAITAATGWLFALEHHRHDTAALLDQHRWLGVVTAVLALGAWLAVRTWSDATSTLRRWVRRIVVWSAAVALTIAAHFGAMLVWGADYFTS